MIRTLKGELYKNISVLGIIGFSVVMLMIAFITFGKDGEINNSNWKEYAEQSKVAYQQQLLSIQNQKNEMNNAEAIKQLVDEITKIDYCLENNYPYGIITVGTFMQNFVYSNKSLIIALIIMIGFCIIFKEDSSKTWKSILTTGVERKKFIFAKLLSMTIIEGIYSIITLVIAYVAGLFKYGNNYKDCTVLVNDGVISIKSNIVIAFKDVIVILLISIFLSMFMYLLYSINVNKNVILMGIYIIVFLSYYVYKFLKVIHLDKATPIKYLFQEELHLFGMFVMVSIYSVAFLILGNKILARKDLINR